MEKIKYELRGSAEEFGKRWELFVNLFEEMFVAEGVGG